MLNKSATSFPLTLVFSTGSFNTYRITFCRSFASVSSINWIISPDLETPAGAYLLLAAFQLAILAGFVEDQVIFRSSLELL